MPPADEVDALAVALRELGLEPGGEVLADQPARRRVVRAGNVVVKAFATVEEAAFAREVAGLRAVAGSGLGPSVVATGRRWTATHWIDGVVPMHLEVDVTAINTAIGPWLARLHAVPPSGLRPWSVADRLQHRLADPPPTCPPDLAADVARLVRPLLPLVTDGAFVHGDWGTANVLVDPAHPTAILAIIDFEDAHRGDPAEDLKWQVLSGPDSAEFTALAGAYPGDLGPHATERLVVSGAELCLDVLGWANLAEPTRTRFHDRCRATLGELVAGRWPAWPHPGSG